MVEILSNSCKLVRRCYGRNLDGLGFSLLNSSFSVSYSSSVMYVFSESIQLNKQQKIASNMKNFDNFSTIFTEISKQLSFCMNRSIRDTYHWIYYYAISYAYHHSGTPEQGSLAWPRLYEPYWFSFVLPSETIPILSIIASIILIF